MQSLHDWHRRPAGPVKAARSSEFEIDSELVHLDRPEPRTGVDCHVRGDGIGQAELIGRRNAIDQKSRLVAASHRVDDCSVIRIGRLPCEPVNAWNIVESASMRRMVFEVARRCRTLSTAALDPISRKSLGVQTPVEFIRSRICALRSSAGPQCGLGVCPIFVVTFRPDLMASACPKNVYIVRTNQK